VRQAAEIFSYGELQSSGQCKGKPFRVWQTQAYFSVPGLFLLLALLAEIRRNYAA
jgi:hypothetical protein